MSAGIRNCQGTSEEVGFWIVLLGKCREEPPAAAAAVSTELGGLKLGSWGSLAKQQQLHLGRSFPQQEMGMEPHEQGWGCLHIPVPGGVEQCQSQL